MLSILIYQIVAKPWTFSIIPGLGKTARIKCYICRGGHQPTERAMHETEVK